MRTALGLAGADAGRGTISKCVRWPGGWARKANTTVGFVSIEEAPNTPNFGCHRRVITLFSSTNLFWLLFSDCAIVKMKSTYLHRRPLQPVRIRILQIIKSDWPA
jgi:hypothetical protein